MCVENICTVTPENVWRLQDMIQSNQTIQFENNFFYMREKGFVIVENVCNVVISGYEQGSHIECSHGASFGFYFKNVINVTITGSQTVVFRFHTIWKQLFQITRHLMVVH